MSVLAIYNEQGKALGKSVTDHDAIAAALGDLGVRFERWPTERPLSRDANQEEVLWYYSAEVERLVDQYGFQSVDVVALRPDNPQREALRQKFLAEHTHSDFEVRFFVDGSGLFYLHVGDKVYLVVCEKGDLISVPAGVTHWFDMGTHPDFKCIRFFVIPEGWVGHATGSDIGRHFPDFDQFRKVVA